MTTPRHRVSSGDQSSNPRQGPSSAALAPLWRAINELALTWAQLPLVQRFAAVLPRNARQRSSGIPGRLQAMQAGGGNISEFPLRLTRNVQLMSRMPDHPFLQAAPPPQEWDVWLDTAMRVETAHRITVAWLRARMPGYPSLPAPQLAPGSPLTADESDFQLTWTRQERAQGLQFQDPPAQIGQVLQAAPPQQRRIAGGMRVAALAFERTDEWSALSTATTALTPSARGELRQARETLVMRLSKEAVDAHSPLLLARFNYRVAVMQEVLSTLSGPAHEYATAFGTANRLVETAASDAFGELVAYGPPLSIPSPQDIDLRPGTPQLVSFTRALTEETEPSGTLEMGQILWLSDPLVPDAIRLIAAQHRFNDSSAIERWTGLILVGTSDAWHLDGI